MRWTGWPDCDASPWLETGKKCDSGSLKNSENGYEFARVRYSGIGKGDDTGTSEDGKKTDSSNGCKKYKKYGLGELLFCESCKKILTRHAKDIVEEIDSYYCPQSLDNLPSSEAAQYGNKSLRVAECPVCRNLLSTHACPKSVLKTLESGEQEEQMYYWHCLHCRWDSINVGIVGKAPEELIKKAIQLEKESDETLGKSIPTLVEYFNQLEVERSGASERTKMRLSSTSLQSRKSDVSNSSSPSFSSSSLWRVKDCEAEFQEKTKEHNAVGDLIVDETLQEIFEFENAKKNGSGELETLLPNRLSLRTKRSTRCRKCLNSNSPNILVKPQINPLKGDSSMRTNVGAWFKKKSLAYDLIPRFTAKYKAEESTLFLVGTNPRDTKALLQFTGGNNDFNGAWTTIDAHDEIEELDLFNSTSPPDPKPPREEDDSSFVSSRLANKVLFKLTDTELPLELEVKLRFPEEEEEEGEQKGLSNIIEFNLVIESEK